MLKKISFSPNVGLETVDLREIKASPHLLDRMDKLANNIKAIAPQSDDFLYFSIIFLKSAEACLIDDKGELKKVAGGETAWGYFDDGWKWHGNVQPHRNNNRDIFPESELRKAAKDWIGMPLCRDHESSSVDGIRGIILDTHYDEKLKQVVGLCALDKVNYPDLARKVQTGLVRYGSMGTAVETSVCTTCGNKAQTQDQYCEHINNKNAWGEINVGLKPIEYSLVVQPAEPGAVLLRCIASLKEYKREFVQHGVKDLDAMLNSLNEKQAQSLEKIMKTACGDEGCSISERKKIVRTFLLSNNLVKEADREVISLEEAERAANIVSRISGGKSLEEISNDADSPEYSFLSRLEVPILGGVGRPEFTGDQRALTGESPLPEEGSQLDGMSPRDLTGSSGPMVASTDGEPRVDTFDTGGVIERNVYTKQNDSELEKRAINSILEDIMNEARLRKRAELRRRIAYHQGGSDGVEPSTYKDERAAEGKARGEDRQMKQDGNMGGDSGMFPGDQQTKEKLSRAELEERRMKRMAYHQGGADGVEPNTFKDESALEKRLRGEDRQMKQDKSMGGDSGMFPGDEQTKQKLSRAKYNGPGLRTKFSAKTASGNLDKEGSVFEVFSGKDRVITATAKEIFGDELSENWNWLSSREYGQEVCKQIRAHGLEHVSALLKSAQDTGAGLPPMPPAEGDAPPLPGGDDLPPPPPVDDMGGDLPPLGDDEGDDLGGEEQDPKEAIEMALVDMEERVDEVRDLVSQLSGGQDVDIDIAVSPEGADLGDEGGEGLEAPALASEMLQNLKTAMAELNESADELALIAETFEGERQLTASQRSDLRKIASDALNDSYDLNVEAKTLVRVTAGLVKSADWGVSNQMADNYVEDDMSVAYVEDSSLEDDVKDHKEDDMADGMHHKMDAPGNDLMAEAMLLRRERREAILKQAEQSDLESRKARREALVKDAQHASVKSEVESLVNDMRSPAEMLGMADDPIDHDDKEDSLDSNAEDPKDHKNEMDHIHGDKEDSLDSSADDGTTVALASSLKGKLQDALADKRAEEERESYKLRLRRAYDVAMDMQRKGLISQTKPSLDRQVDEIMQFDSNAFEAFKRTIANTKPVASVKTASDLGGVNIGVESQEVSSSVRTTVDVLASMWK